MLIVAYDGTNYSGWQVQPHADTIEGQLNRALSALLQEEIIVTGASRTDAGVHSMGNVAVFDTESRIPAEKLALAINTRLPEDIIVQKSMEVRGDFHPRKCDCVKTYEYRIYTGRMENPQLVRYTWHRYGALDVDAMRRAGQFLVGEHDFTSFCAVASDALSKVRTIYSVDVEEQGAVLTIRVRGNGFLYNMVRIIAGTLLGVGIGRISPEDIPGILEGRDRRLAGTTAPAKGLTQMEIAYEEEIYRL
jgi:tRNA pseudouridine38-40 synthase